MAREYVDKFGTLHIDSAAAPVYADPAAEFRRLCEAHDLTYAYADGRVRDLGREQYRRIRSMAATLDHAVAVRIWNETVDAKLAEHSRRDFYWTERSEV